MHKGSKPFEYSADQEHVYGYCCGPRATKLFGLQCSNESRATSMQPDQ